MLKMIRCLMVLPTILSNPALYGTNDDGPAYEAANQCYILKAYQKDLYIARASNGWSLKPSIHDAEAFYFKPTSLGTYLLYDSDGWFFKHRALGVSRAESPARQAEWQLRKLEQTENTDTTLFTFISHAPQMRLRHGNRKAFLDFKNLPIKAHAHGWQLIQMPMESCREFPEASLNADVPDEFYRKKPNKEPIKGFADIHTHIAFPKTMGGGAMAGGVFHPYGIAHALGNCEELHGPNGKHNLLELQQGSKSTGYDTTGYPHFNWWPNRTSTTHIQAYHRWIQRAYLGGLRLIVTHATGNPTFCQLLNILKLGKIEHTCTGIQSVELQTTYMYQLQDYIDAQAGGPGKGWFRIVTSPAEARQVASSNRLAVVLGVEHGTLFNCTEGSTTCTPDYVDQQLDHIHKLGIRVVFPIHRFDNAFGGAKPQGGSNGAWMHLTSKMSTSKINQLTDLINPTKLLFKPIEGHYWQLEECPEGTLGTSSIKSMDEFINKDFAFVTDAIRNVPGIGGFLEKSLDKVFLDKLRPLPTYEEFQGEGRACNSRRLQPIGRHLIQGIIKRGMILDIDHMSYATMQDTMAMLEEHRYSGFVSSHSWFHDQKATQKTFQTLGGLIAPFNDRPSRFAQKVRQYMDKMEDSSLPVAVPIGSDIQGVAAQARADEGLELSYPFQSWDGQVTFYPPQTGERTFNFAKEGMAHYGLFPEWVENLRQNPKNSSSMEAFMRSAEAFIQMWERATSAPQE